MIHFPHTEHLNSGGSKWRIEWQLASVISDKEAMIWVDIYTHNNADNGNGRQVERTKVTGYLSLFLFIIFCGLNRIGFHRIDLKGPSDIIKSIKRCSSIFPYTVVLLFYLLWVWASFTNSIFTNNDSVTNFWVINIDKMLLKLAHILDVMANHLINRSTLIWSPFQYL